MSPDLHNVTDSLILYKVLYALGVSPKQTLVLLQDEFEC